MFCILSSMSSSVNWSCWPSSWHSMNTPTITWGGIKHLYTISGLLLYDTKLHPMVRLQFFIFEECRVSLCWNYFWTRNGSTYLGSIYESNGPFRKDLMFKKCLKTYNCWLIYWLILTACQSTMGHFMPRD